MVVLQVGQRAESTPFPKGAKRACREETEETLRRVRLPQRRRGSTIADRDEITRLWLAERCFSCLRCPKMVSRLARWHAGIGEA